MSLTKAANQEEPRRKVRKQKKQSPVPMRDGVSASRVWLPKRGDTKSKSEEYGQWATILDFLLDRFPFIDKAIQIQRMNQGLIVSETGEPISPTSPYQSEIHVFYYREIPDEPLIPFEEKILFKDDAIIVVDKPHFIPVTPTGRFVRECLLSRLKRRFQNEDISPMHRLDRETAGVTIYGCNAKVRGAYQYLFEKREVKKTYEAIACAPKADLEFPYTHRSHISSSGNPFFIMQEQEGVKPNTETVINIIETKGDLARYKLEPITGKQHQLRVHMAVIGSPIINDPFYPELMPNKGEDYSKPLQLLAKSIQFTDPITNDERFFESEILLDKLI